ncbi:hypothetical protein PoB_003510200 [Plakobranchus ocellatus]|uniref:Uncharacterized protein n=1 Tax=Plakobranchus ocellatus TaxID=259542 RepID=A0AAV4ANT8_9GAST|nr:hypothetical protein PoB_003510200 [Plakobranchus ocellatus]
MNQCLEELNNTNQKARRKIKNSRYVKRKRGGTEELIKTKKQRFLGRIRVERNNKRESLKNKVSKVEQQGMEGLEKKTMKEVRTKRPFGQRGKFSLPEECDVTIIKMSRGNHSDLFLCQRLIRLDCPEAQGKLHVKGVRDESGHHHTGLEPIREMTNMGGVDKTLARAAHTGSGYQGIALSPRLVRAMSRSLKA